MNLDKIRVTRYRREGKEYGKESGQDLFLNELIRENITNISEKITRDFVVFRVYGLESVH